MATLKEIPNNWNETVLNEHSIPQSEVLHKRNLFRTKPKLTLGKNSIQHIYAAYEWNEERCAVFVWCSMFQIITNKSMKNAKYAWKENATNNHIVRFLNLLSDARRTKTIHPNYNL